jgi:hypothetical protein
MPAWLYLRGLLLVVGTASRATFILRRAYPHGVWFYFPALFVLKSSLGFLGLLATALIARLIVARRRRSGAAGSSVIPWEIGLHWRVLWVALLVFTGFCLASRLDIGIRHFSVPLVLLILLLAPLPRLIGEQPAAISASRVLAILAVALAASCLFTAIRAYPFYFAYVNELRFGRPAYAVVNDSNVDWNQSLPEVKKFAEEHGLQKIPLDDYALGDALPTVPRSQLWDCQQPSAGDAGEWVAVSANIILDAHNCAWLMQYPHEALAGGSMYAIHLPDRIPAAGSAGGPPLPSAYHQFIGVTGDIRVLFVELNRHPEKIPRTTQEAQDMLGGFDNQKSSAPASSPSH